MVLTMTKVASPELIDWLNRQLRSRGVAGTRASVDAGLSRGAISSILNGNNPGLEVCKGLADYFGVSSQYVLELAGHIPPVSPCEADPEVRRRGEQLQALWREVRDVDPESAERVMRIAVLQAQMVLAAARGSNSNRDREGEQKKEGVEVS